MAEPVGNGPRKSNDSENLMSGISGNSHKSREKKAEVANREPVEKIIEGKVITRKVPWWTRFGRSMIAEDASHIGDYLFTDVLVPATKDLLFQLVSQSAQRLLFGSSKNQLRRPSGLGLRDRYDYSRPYRDDRDREPRRPFMSREARARHDFNEIVLENRTEAVAVVDALLDRISRYGAVTVADLYDLVGTTGSYADQRWGWYDLSRADVRQVAGGFLLDLPEPEPVR